MNKPYSGNGRPFVLALFAEKDREKVIPVLEALEKKGLTLCGQDGKATEKQAKKACTTITFLSENFSKDEAKQQVFFTADAARMPIIPVKLDDAKQPEVLERSITAKNAIMAERYSTEELAGRIAGAESLKNPTLTKAQKNSSRLRLGLILGIAVIALAFAGLLIYDQQTGSGIIIPTPEQDRLDAALCVLKAIRSCGLTGRITEIDVENPYRISVRYRDYLTVYLAGGATAEEKLRRLEATVEAIRDKYVEGQALHMESEGGYYLK
jgi:hypothetical protein